MKSLLIRLDRGLSRLYRLCGYAAAAFLVAIGVAVLASIVSRQLSIYLPGLTEYSGYAMAASSFLALAYTFERRGHVRVELAISRLNPSARWRAELLCLAIAAAVSAFLATYMGKLAYWSWKFQERSEGADAILIWKPQVFAFAGAAVLAVCTVHHFVKCAATRAVDL